MNWVIALVTLLLCFNGLFSLLFFMSGPSLEHCFSSQNRFLTRHHVTLTPVSWTFFLTFHLTQMCIHFKPQREMGSQPSAGFLELFLDTDSPIERRILSLKGIELWIHLQCVMLFTLRCLSPHFPGHPFLFSLSVVLIPQVHVSSAFDFELRWWAMPSVIPVLLSLLYCWHQVSVCCFDFSATFEGGRWQEKDKSPPYRLEQVSWIIVFFEIGLRSESSSPVWNPHLVHSSEFSFHVLTPLFFLTHLIAEPKKKQKQKRKKERKPGCLHSRKLRTVFPIPETESFILILRMEGRGP